MASTMNAPMALIIRIIIFVIFIFLVLLHFVPAPHQPRNNAASGGDAKN
jgi:hypothetical protein